MLSKQISTRLTRLSYLNPLSIFMAVKTEQTNGFAFFFFFFLSFHTIKRSLSQAPFKVYISPFPPLFFHLRLKAAQHIQSGLVPAFRRHAFNSNTTAQRLPVGLQCQAMTPMCLPGPPSLQSTHPASFFSKCSNVLIQQQGIWPTTPS